jgi:hypothetical protein
MISSLQPKVVTDVRAPIASKLRSASPFRQSRKIAETITGHTNAVERAQFKVGAREDPKARQRPSDRGLGLFCGAIPSALGRFRQIGKAQQIDDHAARTSATCLSARRQL